MENKKEVIFLAVIVKIAILVVFFGGYLIIDSKKPPVSKMKHEYYTEATVTEKFTRNGNFWNSPDQQLRFMYKNGESIVKYVSLSEYNMFDKGEDMYIVLHKNKSVKNYYKTQKSLEDYITKAEGRYIEVLELK